MGKERRIENEAGRNGGTGVDVNNQTGNTGVYVSYTTTAGNGNNQTSNLRGTTGGSAPTETSTVFSGGGGGGSGSGQDRTNATSGGGAGSGGFAIIYLYF